MVGIGGRSKGCRTCRRRKVKCDEGQPSCQRCLKGGFQCDGYIQFSEFIDERNRLMKRGTIKLPSPPKSTTTTISNQNSPTPETHFETIPSLTLTTNPSWNEEDLLNTHLVNRLFTWHEDPASPYAASWISALFKQDGEKSLSGSSLRALATVYFAKVNKQPQLMRRGASFYSQALSRLRVQLENSDLAISDDVIVAVICLGFYESVTFTQPGAWLAHYKGLAKLTAVRGPYRHQEGVGFALLPTIRSCIAIGYIVERKRCFLEDPSWKTIPWALKGEDAKSPTDFLHDILVDIPGLLEDANHSKTWDPIFPGHDSFKAELLPRVQSTLEALYIWRWRWETLFPTATYLAEPTNQNTFPTSIALPPSPFPSVIWFDNPYRATELILYNALRLILTRTLETLDPSFTPETPTPISDTISDPLLPEQGSRNDVAVEICRMADYHLHSLRRSSGAFMLIFPLNVAHNHLDVGSVEARKWLEGVMAVIADLHGFELGRSENMPRRVDTG
ncbi:uncharacterized protein N7511_005380 [Penicillium nucicola]|uniref:uncharacterized protein n=1 Tax=Penicillium nucicola TaxID=1850975 RepID=UPI0025459310|nr:uncharacterized protein N7511_005380 [Penicillium nucicola]KAJ5761998.1 hypothetical protein N7511_005380 [Penicillium nucicola]